MLKAFLRRKLGRPDTDDDDAGGSSAWNSLTAREDPLTSAVFERFSYLDPRDAWVLLRAACADSSQFSEQAPKGHPIWWFWPRLSPGEGGLNAKGVEPDVLVEWDDLLIVIEAKHWGIQGAAQWAEQIRALQADARFKHKRPLFVAAGGADARSFGEIAGRAAKELNLGLDYFCLLRWNTLREAAHALCPRLAPGNARIVEDMIAALEAWGYERRIGFDSLPNTISQLKLKIDPVVLKDWSLGK